jgi:Ca2+-binding RTX toxin-like protein
VGFGDPPPFGTAVIPQTHAFTSNSSAAAGIVPTASCRVHGTPLKVDGRGAPRPGDPETFAADCDAGAIERVPCHSTYAVGTLAFIGRQGRDTIFGSAGDNVVLAQGGDDDIGTGPGADRICAGGGDDFVQPGSDDDLISAGPGTDVLNYNNAQVGGITLDLGAGTATGPSIGTDTFSGFENAQASEDDDTLLGSNGPNRLIGGGDPDTIRGRGGVDIINARDGEADVEINCGPGKNSRERALIDPGIDPAPKSC